MPTVPTYNIPIVAPSNFPDVRQQAPSELDMAGIGAQQQIKLGQQMMAAGGEFGKIAQAEQDRANQVRLNDAKNQLLSQKNALTFNTDPNRGDLGFQAYQGKDALTPDQATGLPLDTVYAGKLKQKASDIAATLSNDYQRQAFAEYSNDAVTQFQAHIGQHMLGEANTYARTTNQGTIQLAADTAGLSYDKPDVVDQQVKAAQAAAYSQTTHDGINGDAQTMAIKMAGSAIHRSVIEAALENNNPQYAMAYKDRYKDGMTYNDTLAVLGKLNHQADASTAQSAVINTVHELSSNIAPTDMDRLKAVRDQLESGGKDFTADGSPVVSAKGAKYKNQVMPATAANPGYGIAPAAADTPAEYNRVGDQLLGALVTKYGDVGKALAAYNAGPGAVDDAVKADPQNWLSKLPKETQAYVQTGVSKFNTGSAAPVFPTEAQFISNALAKLPTTSRPELVALTQQQAQHQYAILDQSRKQQGEQSLDAVQKALVANGGNWAALPSSLVSDLTRYSPGKVDDAMKFGKAVNPANNVETNTEAYAMAVTYPQELAKMSDATFTNFLATNFSVRDQEKISKVRADYINGGADTSMGGINYKAMNTALSNRLTSYGIAMPTPKSSQDDKARVGAIQKFVADDIFAQQQQLGRKLAPEEIFQHIDQMFARNINFKNTVLGIPTGSTQTPMLTMKVGDIPSQDVSTIKLALNKRGVANPTDDQILRTYWIGHSNGK